MDLIRWAGTTIKAFDYTPGATPRELAQYRLELELDRARRNVALPTLRIKALKGDAQPSRSSR